MTGAKEVRRAIRALDKAYDALDGLVGDDPRDGVHRLRGDIREYLEYLEDAKWWREGK